MNLIPLRTAVIAGTCAVALTFVAVPAFAGTEADDPSGASPATTSTTSSDSTGPDAGDPTTDPSTTDPSTGVPSTGTPTSVVSTDDSTDDSADSADSTGTGMADGGSTVGTEDAILLPDEPGQPRQHVRNSQVPVRDFLKHGVQVVFTGLTPGYSYQPFYGTTNSGDVIGTGRTADPHGTIRLTWKPSRTRGAFAKPGEYTLGLAGTQTSLMITTTVVVKRGSDLVWLPAHRTGRTISLAVTADRAPAAASGKDVKWKKVEVDFQKRVGATWVTVTTATTNDRGVAKATFVSGKQVWRAVVDATGSVFGSTTKAFRK